MARDKKEKRRGKNNAGKKALRKMQANVAPDVDARAEKILRRLVSNSAYLYNPYRKPPSRVHEREEGNEFRIATISNDLALPGGRGEKAPDFDILDPQAHIEFDKGEAPEALAELTPKMFEGINMLTHADGFSFAAYRADYLAKIDKAIGEHGANLICLGELAYPHPGRHLPEYKKHELFEKELQDRADKHRVVIIGGSYHCIYRQSNECRIFLPRELDADNHPESEENGASVSPRDYTKRVPALSLREVIRRYPGTDFPYYHTPFGYLALLICLDSFDPGLFLRFLSWHADWSPNNRSHCQAMDVICIPSFSTNDKGADVAKDLSFVCRCIVVYVDTKYCNPSSEIYVCGEELHRWNSSSNLVDEDVFRVRKVDMREFRKRRNEFRELLSQSDLFRALVDNPPPTPLGTARI